MKELKDKIGRFYKKPPFLKVQSVVDKIPLRSLKIARFLLLSLDRLPAQKKSRKASTIRLATIDDVDRMCQLEDKPDLFRMRLARGDFCMLAFDGETLVGYEWFSDAEYYVEERFDYTIDIPPDSVYVYDAFILESYRLRGIWVQLKVFLHRWMVDNGREKMIVLIDYENTLSIKTHIRFGFVPFRDVKWFNLFGKTTALNSDMPLEKRSPELSPQR